MCVAWNLLFDAIHLVHVDSLGNVSKDSVSFTQTDASVAPQIAVNPPYTVVVWDDGISNYIRFFRTYIEGCIVQANPPDTELYTYEMFNDNPMTDAIRGNPNIAFINDTTLAVVWDGNAQGFATQSIVTGQIVSVSGNKIGDNFLVTDHILNGVNSGVPRVIFAPANNFFTVVWEDNSAGVEDLYGRKFDLTGTLIGASFLISDDTAMTNLFYYSAAKDTGGNSVVVWIATKGKKSQIE